jgi:hypothetical protein
MSKNFRRLTDEERRFLKEENKKLVAVDYNPETEEIGLPQELVDELTMTNEQSNKAHGTRLHSLRLMEALILSGRLTRAEMIRLAQTLAEYQFIKASSTRQPAQKEKTIEEYLREIDEHGPDDFLAEVGIDDTK